MLCPRPDSLSSDVLLNPWPHFDSSQIDTATRVLASGNVNTWTGKETSSFESEFASWCGSSHSIAMANGSLALSAAYLSIGLGKGDELITTPRTFIATASSAVLLGAKPIFDDKEAMSSCEIANCIHIRWPTTEMHHGNGFSARRYKRGD